MRRLNAIYAAELVVLGVLLAAALSYRELVTYDQAQALADARAACQSAGEACVSAHIVDPEAFHDRMLQTSSLIWAAVVVLAVLTMWTRGARRARRRAEALGIA